MRRSSREKKKPELYAPTFAKSSPSNYASSEPSTDGDGDEHEIDDFENPKNVVEKSKKAVLTKSKQKASERTSECWLYDCVNVNKKIQLEVEKWISLKETNKVKAVADLVNFILLCAGSSKAWIKIDVDLEGLEPEELDELLSDMIEEMTERNADRYPLNTVGKQGKPLRTRFIEFWEELTDALCNPKPSQLPIAKNISSVAKVTQDLTNLSALLISLSSMAVSSVRDAVTQACLTVCDRLLLTCAEQRRLVDVARRQLLGLRPGADRAGNAKYDTITSQRKEAEKMLELLLTLSATTFFNAIFAHRYKDTNPLIRSSCIHHLGKWIYLDEEDFFKDDYLKYVGWMLSDRSTIVRHEAVKVLCTLIQESKVPKLVYFVQRFSSRFVEIAIGDTDPNISLDMIGALRRMQQVGLLDELEQSQMDMVDELVFDASATLRCRQEALLFVMDHTEGFDDVSEGLQSSQLATLGGGADSATGSRKVSSAAATALSKPARRKSSKGKSEEVEGGDGTDGLLRRQKVARQLETLAEFVAHHLADLVAAPEDATEDPDGLDVLGEDVLFEGATMLVEAFHGLPQMSIVKDWGTMVSLLLREGDGLVSVALEPLHASILLRIFVASGLKTNRSMQSAAEMSSEVEGDNEDAEVPSSKSKKTQANRIARSEALSNPESESLGEVLAKDLSRLLMRYRDDKNNLKHLTSLLEFESLAVAFETQARPVLTKALLKVTHDIFESIHDSVIISHIARGFRMWSRKSGSVNTLTVELVDKLYNFSWERVSNMSEKLRNWNDDSGQKNSSSRSRKQNKRKSGSSGDSSGDPLHNHKNKFLGRDELALDIASSLSRLACLWKEVDCRRFLLHRNSSDTLEKRVEDDASVLVEVADVLLSTYQDGVDVTRKQQQSTTLQAVYDAMNCMFYITLWTQRDILKNISQLTSLETNENHDWELEEANMSVSIISVNSLRDMFLDVMHTWMDLNVNKEDISSQSQGLTTQDSEHSSQLLIDMKTSRFNIHRLKREAFRFIGDIRLLFPEKLSEYAIVNKLVWKPSQEILWSMRIVFEQEGGRIKAQLEQHLRAQYPEQDLDSESEFVTKMLSQQLLDGLLYPLARPMLDDTRQLNRRQAAALACHWLEEFSEDIQAMIKAFMKRLKDEDIVKYLEVQMVTLKTMYQERVNNHKTILDTTDDTQVALQAESDAKNGLVAVLVITKKLSQSLGVARLQNIALNALMNFFRAGFDFVLSNKNYIHFLVILSQYIRFLPPAQSLQLQQYFQQKLDELEDEEFVEFLKHAVDDEMLIVENFLTSLGGKRSKGGKIASILASKPSTTKRYSPSVKSKLINSKAQANHGRRNVAAVDYEERLDDHVGEGEEQEEEEESPNFEDIQKSKSRKRKQPSTVVAGKRTARQGNIETGVGDEDNEDETVDNRATDSRHIGNKSNDSSHSEAVPPRGRGSSGLDGRSFDWASQKRKYDRETLSLLHSPNASQSQRSPNNGYDGDFPDSSVGTASGPSYTAKSATPPFQQPAFGLLLEDIDEEVEEGSDDVLRERNGRRSAKSKPKGSSARESVDEAVSEDDVFEDSELNTRRPRRRI